MNKLTLILAGVCIVLLSGVGFVWKLYADMKADRNRIDRNFEQLTKSSEQTNIDLELTRQEFEKMNTDWSNRMKSVIEESGKKLSQVKEYYELQISYRDSVDKLAKMGEPVEIKEPDKKPVPGIAQSKPKFKVPFSKTDSCQFVKGIVTSTDPRPQVQITDSGFNVAGDLFATRGRFLGFLWWKKPTEYIAVTNCGEIKYKHLKFIKD